MKYLTDAMCGLDYIRLRSFFQRWVKARKIQSPYTPAELANDLIALLRDGDHLSLDVIWGFTGESIKPAK